MAKLSQEQLQAAFSQAQEQRDAFRGGGGERRGSFLRLSGGYNKLRFFPDTEGTPFVYMRLHNYRSPENFRSYLDLEFAMKDATVRAALDEKITNNDQLLTNSFGDPFTRLFYATNGTVKLDDAEHKWLLPRNRFFYSAAIWRDDAWQVGILERGPEFHEQIEALVVGRAVEEDDGSVTRLEPKAGGLLDEDEAIVVETVGNGKEGLQRRYSALDIAPGVHEELVISDEDRPNLQQFMVSRFVSWREKWQVLHDKFGGELLELHGLGASRVEEALNVGF